MSWFQASRTIMLKVSSVVWANQRVGVEMQLISLTAASWVFLSLILEFQWGQTLKAGAFGSLSSTSLRPSWHLGSIHVSRWGVESPSSILF